MIIGIAGVSRSAKSSLAQLLSRQLENSISLSLDDFAYPNHKLPKINDLYDWEVPGAYDLDRLLQATTKMHQSYAIVIVFYDTRMNDLSDRRIILQIDRNEFLERRSKETRWGWNHVGTWTILGKATSAMEADAKETILF